MFPGGIDTIITITVIIITIIIAILSLSLNRNKPLLCLFVPNLLHFFVIVFVFQIQSYYNVAMFNVLIARIIMFIT